MKDFVIATLDIFKTLSNQHRVNILYALYEQDRLWADLVYDYKINPKLLRDHSNHLIERGYILKTKGKGFSITQKGRDLCDLKFLNSSKKETQE